MWRRYRQPTSLRASTMRVGLLMRRIITVENFD
jgi:hypothetical protein